MALPGVARPGATRGGGRQVAEVQVFVCICEQVSQVPRSASMRLCGAGDASLPPRDARRRGSAACRGCLRPAALQRGSRRPGLQRLHPK